MGVHIKLEDAIGEDVPGWDWIRQSYDRDLDEFLCAANGVEQVSDYEVRRRPDLGELATWIRELPIDHQQRYWLLHRLLSEHEDYWIYLSR